MYYDCDHHNAINRIESLRQLISKEVEDEFAHPLSMSFGITEWTSEQSMNEAVNKANAAMLKSKVAGRNRATFAVG